MAVNRHLPQNSPLNSAMGSGTGSGLASTWPILAVIAAIVSALFAGRPYLGSLITQPEMIEEIRRDADTRDAETRRLTEAQLNAQSRQIQNLENQIGQARNDEIRRNENQRLVDDMAEKYQRSIEAAVRVAADAPRQRANNQRKRGKQRDRKAMPLSESADNQPISTVVESVAASTPRVFVHQIHHHRFEYRVTIGSGSVGRDRAYYRERFSKGCNVPESAITDTPRGFIIATDGCEPPTFAGFEIIQRQGPGLDSAPISSPIR